VLSFSTFSAELRRLLAASGECAVVWRTVDSTNAAARRIAAEFASDEAVPPPLWVFAHEQTSGRGRQGRSWVSPAGRGVYATLLLPQVPPADLEMLPAVVALALAEELEAIAGRPCLIKWPNDLVIEARKIGGILIESLLRGGEPATVICGFGINWNHSRGELPREAATSLALEATNSASLPGLAEVTARLALALTAALSPTVAGAPRTAVAARYRARSLHVDGDMLRCSLGHGVVEGRFRGFDERGFLLLETSTGTRVVAAGEVIER
jgi:BirA family transcriptional regulator, biotin operon repressor / biotin---[acetyl-CoA-carboxylase] ligase